MTVTTLHETTFSYARAIERTHTEARIWPVSDAHQTCHEFSLSVDPMQPLSENHDYWGNVVMSFNILPPHQRVVVTGRSVVDTHRKPFVPQPLNEFEISRAQFDYCQFVGAVEYSKEAAILGENAGLHTADRSVSWFQPDSLFSALQNLNGLIFNDFTYCTDSTHVHTHVSEVMEEKRGVCQDFAHVFLAACRAHHIPSRYVSGYLVTRSARSAQGSTASHAWVEALVPNHGWVALDPTNNLLANDSYIKIAQGRDYGDVTPTRGVFKGRGIDCRMSVRVHTLVEESSTTNTREEELVG